MNSLASTRFGASVYFKYSNQSSEKAARDPEWQETREQLKPDIVKCSQYIYLGTYGNVMGLVNPSAKFIERLSNQLQQMGYPTLTYPESTFDNPSEPELEDFSRNLWPRQTKTTVRPFNHLA
jgi:hypothetical protein